MKEARSLVDISSEEINTFTVADILRSRWEEYTKIHEIRNIVAREVDKMLSCRCSMFVYRCRDCGMLVYQLLGCNSRMCSSCGKRYTDQWAKSLSRAMFNVPHRHFVLSIPSQLWPYLKEDRSLWKVYMDAAIETCNDYFPKIMRNPHIRAGAIVVLHPFGKDMKFQPHLHVIVTEGGFAAGKFEPKTFFPAREFARSWQYHVSRKFQEAGLPNELFSQLYKEYSGFYVWVHRSGTIENPKHIAKYLGRYVRHPAIANSRIIGFDGNTVTFFYMDDRNDKTTIHNVDMDVDEFISALVQHIPENQFKMIRYYGAYGRRCKGKFYKQAMQSSIRSTFQDTLYMIGWKFKPRCPYCNGMLELVSMEKTPPPGDYFHWRPKKKERVIWNTIN